MPRKSAPKRSPQPASSPTARKPSPARKRAGQRRPAGSASDPNLQRLQRVLAAAGYGSRRQCEELIVGGRIEVDGQVITQLGTQVDPQTAKIYVDGTLLKREKPAYFVVNKPPGVVTTNRDPQGRTRVIDLVQERQRLFPVGRLDRSSEGLILLTNDGDLAQQLAHPKYGVRKTYRVTVAGKVDSDKLTQMKKGIYIAEGRVGVDGAKILRHRAKATELEILLREGKNREIRRILARLGHKVLTLQRVALGPLRLGELPRGAYRPVTTAELRKLRDEIHIQSKRMAERGDDEYGEEEDSAAEFDSSEPGEDAGRRPTSRLATSAQGKSAQGKSAQGKSAQGKSAARSGKPSQPSGKRPTKSSARITPAKKAGSRKPSAAEAGSPKPARAARDKPLEGPKTIGTVIGGEEQERRPTGKPAERKPSKGKRPPKKGGGERR